MIYLPHNIHVQSHAPAVHWAMAHRTRLLYMQCEVWMDWNGVSRLHATNDNIVRKTCLHYLSTSK